MGCSPNAIPSPNAQYIPPSSGRTHDLSLAYEIIEVISRPADMGEGEPVAVPAGGGDAATESAEEQAEWSWQWQDTASPIVLLLLALLIPAVLLLAASTRGRGARWASRACPP